MNVKEKLEKTFKQYSMLIVLLVIVLVFQVITKGTLLTSLNVFNLVNQNAYIMILSIGMLLVILTGNVDLSVGSTIAFVGACIATFAVEVGMNTYLSIAIGLLIGILIGIWQGFWIAYVRIPPFIATLAGMLILRGGTMLVLTGGKTINPLPDNLTGLASGYIGSQETSGTISIIIGVALALLFIVAQIGGRLRRKREGYEVDSVLSLIARMVIVSAAIVWFFCKLAEKRGVPTVLIWVAIIALVYNYITQKTVLGRHLYALGGNAKAAKLSGIKTERTLFLAYVNMSFLAAISAVAYCARLNASVAAAGDGAEFDAIGACFIGGASAAGGVGTVFNTIVGALIMGILNNGMSILGLGTDLQKAIKGFVLLAAIAIDVISKQKTLDPMIDSIRRKFSK